MSQHGRALAILGVGIAIALGGLAHTREVAAVVDDPEARRLERAVLAYVVEENPAAPIDVFQRFPATLLEESRRTSIDHCLALAQARVESRFRHDAVGSAGEIGLFQMLPSTAAGLERQVGEFRRPARAQGKLDLGDLADPAVSTRFAMAYLRDIMQRRATLREALTEYNAGPAGRNDRYYTTVMAAYVELLERSDLGCRFREAPRPQPALTLAGLV